MKINWNLTVSEMNENKKIDLLSATLQSKTDRTFATVESFNVIDDVYSIIEFSKKYGDLKKYVYKMTKKQLHEEYTVILIPIYTIVK